MLDHLLDTVCIFIRGPHGISFVTKCATLSKMSIIIIIKKFKEANIPESLVSLLTLCLPVSSADNLGKQFGPISGPTICRA